MLFVHRSAPSRAAFVVSALLRLPRRLGQPDVFEDTYLVVRLWLTRFDGIAIAGVRF